MKTSIHLVMLIISALANPLTAKAQMPKFNPLPYPVVNTDTWVLIEIWPDVGDITLSAYFMDFSSGKNQNLCEATKRSLDRDAVTLAKQQKREATSTRQCLTVLAATQAGYIKKNE